MLKTICLATAAFLFAASGACAAAPVTPLAVGDEAIVVTHHTLLLAGRKLAYDAVAGRLPIRHDETGQVLARVFFVAYRVPTAPGAPPRPVTVIWNGGPSTNSLLLHTEMFGPRRLEGDHFADNPETLLATSDLVFYDPVGSGFSRPEKPEDAQQFYGVLGDFAATAEFIRAYSARFGTSRQPLYIAGESYGTWRAAGVAGQLIRMGLPLRGVVLISGGIPGSQMPDAFSDAMAVPARTATAFAQHRLDAALMRDRAQTLAEATTWSERVYQPALANPAALDDPQREAIATALARYTGIDAQLVDRTTLVMSNRRYRQAAATAAQPLNTFDMRLTGEAPDAPGRNAAIAAYLRTDLAYPTDLAYTGLETGYMPDPGPARRSNGARWEYNHVTVTPEMLKRAQEGGGPPGSLPWLQTAMRQDRQLRVFVAAGRYDSLNACAGNAAIVAGMDPDLGQRFRTGCYDGGHMMYRDSAARLQLARDVAGFVAGNRGGN
jgi:carboxypeptidase C (cathepsin A)